MTRSLKSLFRIGLAGSALLAVAGCYYPPGYDAEPGYGAAGYAPGYAPGYVQPYAAAPVIIGGGYEGGGGYWAGGHPPPPPPPGG